MKTILYSIGRTTSGQLIKAVDTEKETPYACPVRDRQLILRKGKKRPHFAHKALSPNCTPESALHHGFKTLLFDKIQQRFLFTFEPIRGYFHPHQHKQTTSKYRETMRQQIESWRSLIGKGASAEPFSMSDRIAHSPIRSHFLNKAVKIGLSNST